MHAGVTFFVNLRPSPTADAHTHRRGQRESRQEGRGGGGEGPGREAKPARDIEIRAGGKGRLQGADLMRTEGNANISST